MTLSAWWLLAAAAPVVLTGEWLVRRVAVLGRFGIPAPVVGGLAAAGLLAAARSAWPHLAGGAAADGPLVVGTKVPSAAPWLWPVHPMDGAALDVFLPLSIGFFTCVGLNASAGVVRRGGWPLVLLLLVATALATVQNLVGIAMATAMGQPWAFGLVCGSVTLTGGPSTAMGLAADLERAGLAGAKELGIAAATFGIVAGSLVGGPVATRLARRGARGLARTAPADVVAATGIAAPPPVAATWCSKVAALARDWPQALLVLAVLLACMKAGAWVSLGFRSAAVPLPVYMGALLVGSAVRNVADLVRPGLFRTETVDRVASVLLALFLAVAIAGIDLAALARVAGPMLAILLVQVVVMAAYATRVTFPSMGGDHEAVVVAAGHCGFGLGITPNAVANMEAVRGRYGQAPKAFLIVTAVGAFLIDFANSLVVVGFLNVFGRGGG